jgi:hypothetical protein
MGKVQKTVDRLNKKRFTAQSFNTMAEAKKAIMKLISSNQSVGTGGSMTLKDSGILQDLRDQGSAVYSYMLDTPKDAAHHKQLRDQAMHADWFMSSSNAITQKGELVNIDGLGNRVAALTFGYNNVIVLAGKNKIVNNYKAAIKRIQTEACGKNARRLNRKTPCAKDNQCHNCKGKDRMCNITSKIQYPSSGRTMYVFIVKEEWGY